MSDKKRILIIGQHYWPETFRISDIGQGLVEQGYEVDVLCGIPNYPAGKFFKGYGLFRKRRQVHDGVNIIRVPEIPRGNNSNFRILINYLSYPFFALFYVPWLMTKKYDRILVYQLSPVLMAFPGIVLAKLKHIKIYIYITDMWPDNFFSVVNVTNKTLRRILTNMSYWHYRQADGLIGVFKGVQNMLIKDVGIDRAKTLYIPQVAEKLYSKEVFDEELQKRFAGNFNILFAGNINPAQSFDTVLSAAKTVYDAGYTKVHYIIVGEGMSKKWVMSEVRHLGLQDNFSFEGLKPVEEIPKYQTAADALIAALTRSPIFEYGIPAKINSYMLSGRPIVGAIDGDGQRLINRSGCGICVDSGDADGLAKAIVQLVDMSPAERKKMGEKGRSYSDKYFDRDENLRRLIEFVFNGNRIVDTEFGE